MKHFVSLFCLFFASFASQAQPETMVAVAIDVSYSVSDEEYFIQKEGVAEALSDPEILQLINKCNRGGVGFYYFEWSGGTRGGPFIQEVVPWTLLESPTSIVSVAKRIMQHERSTLGGATDIAKALDFAHKAILEAPFQAIRKVISISGDGRQTKLGGDEHVRKVRNRVLSSGDITINGIAIQQTETQSLYEDGGIPAIGGDHEMLKYFEKNVQGGPGSFVIEVKDFNDYGKALKTQLFRALNNCMV